MLDTSTTPRGIYTDLGPDSLEQTKPMRPQTKLQLPVSSTTRPSFFDIDIQTLDQRPDLR
jgi:hypothetical protein